MTETYDNDDHFDITYVIIVWFAFLPTVIVPWFISHWLLIGALKKADRFLPPYVNNGHQSETRRHSVLPRHPAAANASAQWSIGRKIKRYTLHCTALHCTVILNPIPPRQGFFDHRDCISHDRNATANLSQARPNILPHFF